MNTLSAEKKLAVISGLVEGNSIRSISRMTDVDRNTINSLLLRTGERLKAACALHFAHYNFAGFTHRFA
jgi:transposase-like protein